MAIQKLPLPPQGPLARVTNRLSDGQWLVTGATANSETIVLHHEDLDVEEMKEGEEVILDPNQRVIVARLPKRESRTLVE
ncbi:MAG: AAA family ATPase, partial [Nitrospinaceae bacterium]|nr:AAA family ATPase [Nitrospinaceae bacterium]NIU94807.1 AAA family ATPase [Nitrospinaceae bacterium]NIW04346.1 AAA family ATPase [Nitrospinaceae bacterium]NIW57522.1 AAA family ATPase [Nitrospinaceae bacterium]NIX32834.1 AAA family ATPase [Nitrospinaceae bacterium]